MALQHWHFREWRLLALVGASLVVIGLYLSAGLSELQHEGSGWRRIDQRAFQRRLDAGDLTDHEASWYHPARPEELAPGDGAR
jgi:hypothetical protein